MTIALVNLNSYLGGGETLLVRWSEYLHKEGYDFKSFFVAGSYIEKDLNRIGIPIFNQCPISSPVDYYYLKDNQRMQLRGEISKYLQNDEDVVFVSFDARDLYTVFDISKNNERYRVAHLILHDEDNLYVCQSLLDKFNLRFRKIRNFTATRMLAFNCKLFNEVSRQGVVIPMCEYQCDIWKNNFGINIDKTLTVPLPVCDFSKIDHEVPAQNHKILWIGRIVDFKIPSLCAMIDYVGENPKYSLTIIGGGDLDYVHRYIRKKGYDESFYKFEGKVNYADLPSIIKQHSIGYAMGTSPVEIGKHGLPVIMALGKLDYKNFEKPVCGGLFINISKGNCGGSLYSNEPNDKVVMIKNVIEELESDFNNLSLQCYNYLRDNYDSETNFALYTDYVMKAGFIKSELKVPHASKVRRLLYYRFR